MLFQVDLQSLLLQLKLLKKIKDEDKDFGLIETNLLKEERKQGYYRGDANHIAEAIFPPDAFGCFLVTDLLMIGIGKISMIL